MLGKFRFAFVVVTIGGTLLSIEVESQSPVDDSPSCESFTLNEAVNLIREDLKGVKHVCESNEQQCTPTECSTPKEALISSLLCEYRTRDRCLSSVTIITMMYRKISNLPTLSQTSGE